ncbi:MAG TPA: hypothetical protein PKM21_07550 [Anaerolineales bacterium]|nr:hypothetical protein [Anaerolineales bacterium]
MMTQNRPGIPKRSALLQVFLRQLVPNFGTIVVVAAMLFAYSARASSGISPDAPADPDVVAGSIPYQGTLTDKGGNPVNGTVTMTFRLYVSPTGGTALWEETQNIKVSNGLFNAYLGSLTPIAATIWEQPDVYLGVQVTGDSEMLPRELVRDVPSAMSLPAGTINSSNTHLEAGQIQASIPDTHRISLTEDPQDVPGTTLTLSPQSEQKYLVFVTADLEVSSALAIAHLYVDDMPQGEQIIFENLAGTGRATVSQTFKWLTKTGHEKGQK